MRKQHCLLWIFVWAITLGSGPWDGSAEPTNAVEVREIDISVVPGRLLFNPRKVTAVPGEKFRFKIRNTSEIPHNFVLCDQPDSWREAADAAIAQGEAGAATGYHPGPPLVTRATAMIQPGGEATLEWVAPPGGETYSFLSTVPGHASSMRGEIVVFESDYLSNITYEYYEGGWKTLEEFSQGKPDQPHESGEIAGNRIDLSAVSALAQRKKERAKSKLRAGLIVTAGVRLPEMGNYDFAVLDQHFPVKLTIPDAVTIEHDGTGATPLVGRSTESIDDGVYDLRLEVVEGEKDLATPAIAWRGPGGAALLSVGSDEEISWPDRHVIESESERPLAITMPMPDSSETSLAVALPYGVHYCFDPETLCVRYAWEGDFLDASPRPDDGSGRPGGNCKPLGKVLPLGGVTGFPLRIGNLATAPQVRYLGHTDGSATEEPELVFRVGEYTVLQKISAASSPSSSFPVRFTFRVEPPPAAGVPIVFHADADVVDLEARGGLIRNGVALFQLGEGKNEVSVQLTSKVVE